MYNKFKKIFKIYSIVLFVFLLLASNQSYAWNVDDEIERFYEEVETEDGVFYKRKKSDKKVYKPYSIPQKVFSEENKKVVKIMLEEIDEYMTRFINESCSEDQRIEKEYTKSVMNIYSVTDEKPYKDGDEINGLISVLVTPIKFDSNFWKENFCNNEIYYDEFEEKYHFDMVYYIRLVFNEEKNEYEIAYIDFEPENLEEELEKLKEKGLDLKNLKIKDLMNISYDDQIKAVSSSESTSVTVQKIEYNSNQIKEISNTTLIIRGVCISLIIIVILGGIIKFWKENK